MSAHAQCSICTCSVEGIPSLVCLHMLSAGTSLISMQCKHWRRWSIFGEAPPSLVCNVNIGEGEVFLVKMKKNKKICNLRQKICNLCQKSFIFTTKILHLRQKPWIKPWLTELTTLITETQTDSVYRLGVKMSSYWFYFDTFLDCPKQNLEVSLVNIDLFLRNKAQVRRNLLMAGDSVGVGNEHLLEFTGVSIEYSAWLNNELYKTIASFHLLNASSHSLMNCAASMT